MKSALIKTNALILSLLISSASAFANHEGHYPVKELRRMAAFCNEVLPFNNELCSVKIVEFSIDQAPSINAVKFFCYENSSKISYGEPRESIKSMAYSRSNCLSKALKYYPKQKEQIKNAYVKCNAFNNLLDADTNKEYWASNALTTKAIAECETPGEEIF